VRSKDVALNSLATELARLQEIIRLREPSAAEASDALVGIKRQLAASEPPPSITWVENGKAGSKKKKKSEASDKLENSDESKAAKESEGSDKPETPQKSGKGKTKAEAPKTSRLRHFAKPKNRAKPKPKTQRPRKRKSRTQLLEELIQDAERLTLMLVSKETTAKVASETFAEFRQSVITVASQRRKHLADLAYLHSLLAGIENVKSADNTKTDAPKSDKSSSSKAPNMEQMASIALAEVGDMFNRCGGIVLKEYSQKDKEHFEVSGKGTELRVLRPAYLATNEDGRTMVVARGAVEGS